MRDEDGYSEIRIERTDSDPSYLTRSSRCRCRLKQRGHHVLSFRSSSAGAFLAVIVPITRLYSALRASCIAAARSDFGSGIKYDHEIYRMFRKFLQMWFLVTLVALAIRQVTPTPSASSVGSDLTFLFQNDLNCE